jgi:hypothetical protein
VDPYLIVELQYVRFDRLKAMAAVETTARKLPPQMEAVRDGLLHSHQMQSES